MVLCFDTNGFIYLVMAAVATNITGSFYLATLVLALLIWGVVAMFGVPIEYSAILLLPLHLGFLACLGTDWLGFTGIILVYLGILLGKHLFFRS